MTPITLLLERSEDALGYMRASVRKQCHAVGKAGGKKGKNTKEEKFRPVGFVGRRRLRRGRTRGLNQGGGEIGPRKTYFPNAEGPPSPMSGKQ